MRAEHNTLMALYHLDHIAQFRQAQNLKLTPFLARIKRIELWHKNQHITRRRRQLNANKHREIAKSLFQNSPSNISRCSTINDRYRIQSLLTRIRNRALNRGATARSGVYVQINEHKVHGYKKVSTPIRDKVGAR